MTPATERKLMRWLHIIFGMPLLGYIYGPPEEVLQYAPIFRYVFVPILFLSGFWMWKGHVVKQLISRKSN